MVYIFFSWGRRVGFKFIEGFSSLVCLFKEEGILILVSKKLKVDLDL